MQEPDTQKLNKKTTNDNSKNGNGLFDGDVSGIPALKYRIAKKWNSDTPVGSIFRNMAMLATGSGLAKIIGLIAYPIITRIYLPEHMGVLAIFTALTAILTPFGTLRYSMAIPLPRNDGSATNLAILCGILLVTYSILMFLILLVLSPTILGFFSMEQLLPYWWLLPVAIVGTGFYEILTHWAIREKSFKPLAKTKVWQIGIGSILKIGLGFIGIKPLGLLIGQVFNQSGGIISLLRVFNQKLLANLKFVSIKRIKFMFQRYADFPAYRLPSQLLLLLSTKMPLFFFAWHYGADITGQLGLAFIVIALPITLFGQTTGQAYYSEIAKIGREKPEKIYGITKKLIKNLFFISIPPFLILLFMGPTLFQIVFGEMWRESGVFASYLSIYLLTQFIFSPIGNVLTLFRRQDIILMIHSARLIFILIIFYISYSILLSPTSTILIYSIFIGVNYAIGSFICVSFLKSKLSDSK